MTPEVSIEEAPRLLAVHATSELLARGVAAMLERSRTWRVADDDIVSALCDVELFEVDDEETARATIVSERFALANHPVLMCPRPSHCQMSIAMSGGARGVLSPLLGSEAFTAALSRVASGERVVALAPSELGLHAASGDPALSAREKQVLTLVGAGFANDEIAAVTLLSPNTVKSYLRCAYRKIGVSRRVDAVLWLQRQG